MIEINVAIKSTNLKDKITQAIRQAEENLAQMNAASQKISEVKSNEHQALKAAIRNIQVLRTEFSKSINVLNEIYNQTKKCINENKNVNDIYVDACNLRDFLQQTSSTLLKEHERISSAALQHRENIQDECVQQLTELTNTLVKESFTDAAYQIYMNKEKELNNMFVIAADIISLDNLYGRTSDAYKTQIQRAKIFKQEKHLIDYKPTLSELKKLVDNLKQQLNAVTDSGDNKSIDTFKCLADDLNVKLTTFQSNMSQKDKCTVVDLRRLRAEFASTLAKPEYIAAITAHRGSFLWRGVMNALAAIERFLHLTITSKPYSAKSAFFSTNTAKNVEQFVENVDAYIATKP